MISRWTNTGAPRGDDYDARWAAMAERGENPHGEVDFVERIGVTGSVLDAGCGTGRVAIELARRGHDVVGVDLDERMLDAARRKGPEIPWVATDLATLDIGRRFDAVVLAGNVMIFVAPGTERAVIERAAAHLHDGGLLIAGFQQHGDGFGVEDHDAAAAATGLEPVERYSNWDGDPWADGSDYAVSVHRKPGG